MSFIYQELEQALYSHAFGGFESVPYCELVCKIEASRRYIEAEREKWKSTIIDRQYQIHNMEQHIKEVKMEIRAVKPMETDLEKQLKEVLDTLEATKAQVSER